MRSTKTLSLLMTPVMALAATFAGSISQASDAGDLHELLRSSVSANLAREEKFSLVHMLPDQDVVAASEATSIEAAIKLIKNTSLSKLTKETRLQPAGSALNADDVLSRHPLTIVLVPGIFGEFITTRAFEEVLSQPSADRDAFKVKVDAAIAAKDSGGSDLSFDLRALKEQPKALTDLVNVGTLKDKNGHAIARVVLLATPFLSLESMGSLQGHAAMFNRRLEKYLALTGPQDLALIGYSRGTDLALEMLAQAKERRAEWLANTKAMISLGGVAWGSTLADDTENLNSATAQALGEVKKLRDAVDPKSVMNTLSAWRSFSTAMLWLAPKLTAHPKSPDKSELKASPLSSGVDAGSVIGLITLLWTHLGLEHPIDEFSNNVIRFQKLVDAAVEGVGQLTSKSRQIWWASHALPLNVKYYAITGAMANPEASDVDSLAFNTVIGYNKTFDDLSLLQNRLDYESISGIALNDSQVSIAQAMILPLAAAQLNPANAGMKSAFLGTVGTHHWGLALRTVNAMKDGRMNPFPREALLKSLAAKVALDADQGR